MESVTVVGGIIALCAICALVLAAGLARAAAQDERDRAATEHLWREKL